MTDPSSSGCASCGKREGEVRKLLSVQGPVLCDECIRRYAVAMQQALEDDSRRRSGVSELVAAEEMALNLIEALETTRAERAQESLHAESNIQPLRLVQVEQDPPFMTPPDPPEFFPAPISEDLHAPAQPAPSDTAGDVLWDDEGPLPLERIDDGGDVEGDE